jgi:hypothetical protein
MKQVQLRSNTSQPQSTSNEQACTRTDLLEVLPSDTFIDSLRSASTKELNTRCTPSCTTEATHTSLYVDMQDISGGLQADGACAYLLTLTRTLLRQRIMRSPSSCAQEYSRAPGKTIEPPLYWNSQHVPSRSAPSPHEASGPAGSGARKSSCCPCVDPYCSRGQSARRGSRTQH